MAAPGRAGVGARPAPLGRSPGAPLPGALLPRVVHPAQGPGRRRALLSAGQERRLQGQFLHPRLELRRAAVVRCGDLMLGWAISWKGFVVVLVHELGMGVSKRRWWFR